MLSEQQCFFRNRIYVRQSKRCSICANASTMQSMIIGGRPNCVSRTSYKCAIPSHYTGIDSGVPREQISVAFSQIYPDYNHNFFGVVYMFRINGLMGLSVLRYFSEQETEFHLPSPKCVIAKILNALHRVPCDYRLF